MLILSVLKDKLLLTNSTGFNQLFIYNLEGHHLSTITIRENYTLYAATWTYRGNLIYTTVNIGRVVLMSSTSGKTFTTRVQLPLGLYVSTYDNIYIADYWEGVYESTDGGITWSFVFQLVDGWHSIEVVKVETDLSNDFWTIARRDDNFQLHVYSIDKIHHHANITWRNITTKPISLTDAKLSYDGKDSIFLSDVNQAVHVFATNGSYRSQLLLSRDINFFPCKLTTVRQRHRLYVKQSKGISLVIQLIYNNTSD